jgi:hypothetical protein
MALLQETLPVPCHEHESAATAGSNFVQQEFELT